MRIRVIGGVADLARDQRDIAVRARADMIGVVREGINTGRSVAKDIAKRSAGSHGGVAGGKVQPYVKSITAEMTLHGALGLIAGEWGPDESLPQGDMSWENGSRNQPPHRDIARSGDMVVPAFHREVSDTVAGWFR